MAARAGLAKWHAALGAGGNPGDLAAIIRTDAVFHSPVVHTPQRGRELVIAYLSAASKLLGNDNFRYVRELVDGRGALLEFETEIDGVHVNGVDLIQFDENGMIADFKVLVRPLKAVTKVWEAMAGELTRPRT